MRIPWSSALNDGRASGWRKVFSLGEAARAARTSKRTLARRMHKVLGKSPLSYFQDLRIELAVHLLRTSDEGVEEIASRVGYADGVALRVLLRRRLGRGVRELRPRREINLTA
jgi:transcriptional regulator GlxA family with amidase domain